MRLLNLLFVLTALCSLGGCAENSGNNNLNGSPTDTTTAVQKPEAGNDSSVSGSNSDAKEDIQGVYTDLNLDDCEVLQTFEEGGGVELRCPGYKDIPLFVSEGDLRFDIDVGVPNNKWTSQSAFNTLGEKVEWRLRNGRPFAVIIRYYLDDGSGTGTRLPSVLAVLTVGGEGSPGCLVGWVPANAKPSQNEAARQLADQQAEGFDCSMAEG